MPGSWRASAAPRAAIGSRALRPRSPRRRHSRRRGADRVRARCAAGAGGVRRPGARAARRLDRAASEHARRPRDDLARRPRRALAPLGEHPLAARAHPEDLAGVELELLAAIARDLRPELARRPSRTSSTRTSKPRWTTRSTIASAAPRSGSSGSSRSCGRTHASPSRLTRADEAHHELVRRLLVELARRRRPARSGPSFMTTIWSATSIASSWSCVTKTVVTCTSSCSRRSQLAQLRADARVERAERLVEQQHLRLDGERAGERHALPLAARELRRVAVARSRSSCTSSSSSSTRARDLVPSAARGPSGRTRRCRARSCA